MGVQHSDSNNCATKTEGGSMVADPYSADS
jgi:hypothetical protein